MLPLQYEQCDCSSLSESEEQMEMQDTNWAIIP